MKDKFNMFKIQQCTFAKFNTPGLSTSMARFVFESSKEIFKLCYTYSQCQKHANNTLNEDQLYYTIREKIKHFLL